MSSPVSVQRSKASLQVPQREFDEGLLSTAIIAVIVAIVCFLLFWILRAIFKTVYRYYTTHPRHPPEDNKWTSWIMNCIWRYRDENTLKTHGLDVLMYFWIVRICLFMVIGMLIFSIIFILPLNIAGSRNRQPTRTITKFYKGDTDQELTTPEERSCGCYSVREEETVINPTSGTAIQTMANIDPQRSPDKYFQIAHTFMMIYTTILFIWLTHWVYKKYDAYRMRYKLRKKPENYTVRISGFDKNMIKSGGDMKDVMESIFGKNSVQAVHIAPVGPGVSKLMLLRKKRFGYVQKKRIIFMGITTNGTKKTRKR